MFNLMIDVHCTFLRSLNHWTHIKIQFFSIIKRFYGGKRITTRFVSARNHSRRSKIPHKTSSTHPNYLAKICWEFDLELFMAEIPEQANNLLSMQRPGLLCIKIDESPAQLIVYWYVCLLITTRFVLFKVLLFFLLSCSMSCSRSVCVRSRRSWVIDWLNNVATKQFIRAPSEAQ